MTPNINNLHILFHWYTPKTTEVGRRFFVAYEGEIGYSRKLFATDHKYCTIINSSCMSMK